jgi:hypothetical protein
LFTLLGCHVLHALGTHAATVTTTLHLLELIRCQQAVAIGICPGKTLLNGIIISIVIRTLRAVFWSRHRGEFFKIQRTIAIAVDTAEHLHTALAVVLALMLALMLALVLALTLLPLRLCVLVSSGLRQLGLLSHCQQRQRRRNCQTQTDHFFEM